ncbi:MAG TPA: trigger factor family protein, partial [Patescibacteria group bacterium]|nr:trigger factor family protein [Patescibacteria group bacterium]
MSHTIHTLPDAQREIRAVIPWNEWKDIFNSFFEEAIRSVSIKGFRAGKAPRALAAQQVNRAAVATEAAHKKIAQHYTDVVQKEKLAVLGEPEIAIQKLAEGNELAYNAKILLMPDVKLSMWRDAVAV